MSNEIKFNPEFHGAGYGMVGNTGLKNWQAINEIIANSVDSWIEGKTKKDLKIHIQLDNKKNNLKDSSLRISDNAGGMSLEDIKKLFSFFDSHKRSSPIKDKLLGFYGFGFKASSAKIGKLVTVITSDNNKEYYKIDANHDELEKMGKDIEFKIKVHKHNSQSKNMFNGSSNGTIVEIKYFNSSLNPATLYEYLPVSWKKFMHGELFEKKLKIYIGDDTTKKNELSPYSLDIEPRTKSPINVNFEFKDDEGQTQKGSVTGYFGFRFNNLNQITQGFNVYRHGQLIYRHHHELYMGLGKTVRADHNSLVGELDLDINVNTVKSFLEDGEEKEALYEAFLDEFKKYTPTVKKMSRAAQDKKTDDDRKFEIAQYREEFGFTLSADEKKILKSEGDISVDKNKKTKGGSVQTPASKTTNSKENQTSIAFKIIDWNMYKIGDKKYTVEFTPFDDDPVNLPYEILSHEGTTLRLYVYTKNPNGKILMDAISSKSKNKSSKLLLNLIVSEVIVLFLESRTPKVSKKDIQSIKEIILNG